MLWPCKSSFLKKVFLTLFLTGRLIPRKRAHPACLPHLRQAMEERQRQLRAGDAPPPRLSTQHIYNAVNAQMGIIQAQASRCLT